MAPLVGTRLGWYEIVDTLGAGGMGEVYRALDTKLKRTVALKVLPDAFAHDAERLMRFEREAELATLKPVLTAAARRAAKIPTFKMIPTDWQPDGRQVIFSAPTRETSFDLWLLPIDDDAGTPTRFITSPGEQMHGNFSPDGRLGAYTSNESGKFEVYVETVPPTDRKWSVSANGGYEPRWRGTDTRSTTCPRTGSS